MSDRQILLEFIEAYKNEPCLWKIQSREYRDRNLKKAAYSKLVDKLRIIDPLANRDRVVKKINNLRTNFRKELRKVAASKILGQAVYRPSLWYFEPLQFLVDLENENSTGNSSDHSESEESNEPPEFKPEKYFESVSSPFMVEGKFQAESELFANPTNQSATSDPLFTTSEPLCKKTKHNDDYNVSMSLLQKSCDSKEEDQFDLFGKIVAAKLRDIDNKTQRIIAQKIINDALFEAEMGTLSINHKLNKQVI